MSAHSHSTAAESKGGRPDLSGFPPAGPKGSVPPSSTNLIQQSFHRLTMQLRGFINPSLFVLLPDISLVSCPSSHVNRNLRIGILLKAEDMKQLSSIQWLPETTASVERGLPKTHSKCLFSKFRMSSKIWWLSLGEYIASTKNCSFSDNPINSKIGLAYPYNKIFPILHVLLFYGRKLCF